MNIEQLYFKNFEKIFPNIPDTLKKYFKLKQIPPQEIIFHKGEKINFIYILFKGTLKVLNIFKNGHIFEIAKNKPITFIGEQEIISGNTYYSVTLKTITSCSFFVIDTKTFWEWLKNDQELCLYLLKQLSERSYYNSLIKGKNSYLSSLELVIIYFIELYNKNSKEELIIEQTQQELSEQIGISHRSFSRVISYFKKNNIISIKRKKIIISHEQYEMLLEYENI